AAARVERWAMPTWCHMLNSTLIGVARVWFDELPPESIDGYKDLKAAFLAYFMQQKKYVKDPVEIHNIKQRDGETIEDFMERFKTETGRMKGAPECMRISGFMHGGKWLPLAKRRATYPGRHKISPKGKPQIKGPTSGVTPGKEGGLTGSPPYKNAERNLGAKASKFQPPPPMVTPVKKRSSNKFYDFHNDKGHSTDECMQLKKQIKELVRAGKLSHLIKEIKQGRDQSKTGKKETTVKDKPTTIYMSKIKSQMVPATTSLAGFSSETIWPLGQLRLLVIIGDTAHSTKAWMNFMIVKSFSPYNGIIGRPGLKAIQAVPSTVHGMLKFPVEGEIVTICSTILIPTKCASRLPRSGRYVPVRQKKRGQAPKRAKAIQAEVQQLVEAGIMREVYYHDWLSNPVMTLKKATTKYSWQKRMKRRQLSTRDKGVQGQIGRNIEVYVDDLVVKSYTEPEMMRDIEGTFRTLRKVNMKLNPKKCSFGLTEGVFLEYVVTPEGIKPCPDKTSVVLQLPAPRTIKEVQSLNGKLASLNRFLSKSAKKSLPPFQALKKCIKKSDFHWTVEAEQAFQQLKQHLSELPLFVAPKPQEELIIYLSATYGAISTVLMTERGTAQMSIYFISRGLQCSELNYSPMEKLVLSLVFATKRLRQYFQAHPITVITDQPIKQVMSRPDVAGRLQKWSIMLGEHNITYRPRTSVKEKSYQIFSLRCRAMSHKLCQRQKIKKNRRRFSQTARHFTASNNKAEYEALVTGLRIAARMGVQNVQVSVDSKLVANQVLGTYMAKEDNMVNGLLKRRSSLRKQEGGKKAPPQGPSIRVIGGGPLQMIVPYTVVKMRRTTPGEICPFPKEPGKVKFLIVSMDYFTKWIEAKAVATITGRQVKKFVWDNIVCRFGIPGEIISYNGKQFSDNPFKDWCDKPNITQQFASVKHPQSNGLVEELPRVLWAHRTMIKSSHSDTPFSLTYGTEVVIPTEIGIVTYRTAAVDVVNNDEDVRLNLDLLEERQERATIREANAKSKMMKYYNTRGSRHCL
nr:reverse transcriptase domain-containing protein [Tanacetum cinerariifolium]